MPEPELEWVLLNKSVEAALIPGTDERVTGNATDDTRTKWDKELKRRGIVPDNPNRTFHDCACRALPEDRRGRICRYIDEQTDAGLRVPRVIRLDDIWGFFAKVKAWWNSEDEPVTQEEANRRAAICASCPMNQTIYGLGCGSCSNVLTRIGSEVFSLIANKRTTSDDGLKNCAVCACSLKVIVHAPLSVLNENQDPERASEWPLHCWRR